jgi:hypothetical protein
MTNSYFHDPAADLKIFIFTDFMILRWLIIIVNFVLGLMHRVVWAILPAFRRLSLPPSFDSVLKMEAVCMFETSAITPVTTTRNNPGTQLTANLYVFIS